MTRALKIEENIGLVHFHAKRGFKWADGAGSGLTYEDMFQVASLAFWTAVQGFNPDNGNGFAAYYGMVAYSEFRKEIGVMTGVKNLNPGQRSDIEARKQENARRRAAGEAQLPEMNYGLAPVSFGEIGGGNEDGDFTPFEDTLASPERTPEEIVEFRQQWELATAGISPLAELVIDWLRDPPPALQQELASQAAHADLITAAGGRAHGLRDGVSVKAVIKFLAMVGDVSREELMMVEAELRGIVSKLEKA
ncbi:sigma factor [Duganella sp. FT27W]|uniref:sigma factor n=1 Tax=Duganella sp. FT27W TaxID=2654636 RepID=UPI00128BD53B|nr:sigma factor [Duganella sp. FT27W]MPQ56340.1 hypothetical protein [Duganella sp. FT27W]